MRTWHYIISEHCNMKCTYCDVDVDNLTKLSNEKFDEFYSNIPREQFIFDIFGGEPFLQINEVQHIVNTLSDDKLCTRINITTNGTLTVDKAIGEIVSNPKVNTTVSFDGLSQRINRGKQKLYLNDLIEVGVIKAHTMLIGSQFEDTGNYLIDNHIYIEEAGLIPNMTLVRDVGTWTDVQSQNFLRQFKEYIQFMIPKINNDEPVPGLIQTYLNAILEFKIKGNAKTDCRCGTDYNAILPTGDMVPCERFARDQETFDKFKDNDLRSFIMNECNTCEIRDVCHKGCIYEQLKNNAPISELCAIYKGIVVELKVLLQSTNHKLLKQFTKENL